MTTLDQLLSQRRTVLLDFDGPVCAVFSTVTDREVSRDLVDVIGYGLPAEVSGSGDPFDVLRHVATGNNLALLASVERRFTELECSAVLSARPTTDADSVIRELAARSFRIAIVTNNSAQAAQLYLREQDLSRHVAAVFGRPGTRVDLLKPNPYLLQSAVRDLQTTADDCVFIGDSATDIEAAKAASVAVVAFANKPAKVDRLSRLQPDSLIVRMDEILDALPIRTTDRQR